MRYKSCVTFKSSCYLIVTVGTNPNSHRAKESYAPADRLLSFMNDLLLLESKLEGRQRKEDAGEKLSEIEIKESDEYRQRRRALDKRKSEILTEFIFPSMANLTKFFEYAADSRLRRIFDKDIQALFFGESQLSTNHESVFYRFVSAMFAHDERMLTEEGDSDFRFALYEIVQREIWELFRSMGIHKLKDDLLLQNVLIPDMGRAVSWTSSFAAKARGNIDFDKDRRPVLF